MTIWQEHIISDQEVLAGKPVIKDTRLSVELIMGRLASGWTETELFESYPRLTPDALRAVYAYAYDILREGLLVADVPQRA